MKSRLDDVARLGTGLLVGLVATAAGAEVGLAPPGTVPSPPSGPPRYSRAFPPTCTSIDFEGGGNGAPIGTILSPGPPAPDVIFGTSWLYVIDQDAGGNGNFANEPSPSAIAYFLGTNDPINFSVPIGYLSIKYTAAQVSIPVTLNAYGLADCAGPVLQSALGTTVGTNPPVACNGDPSGTFCLFDTLTLDRGGPVDVRSICIAGAVANQFGFDDMSFCESAPTCTPPVAGAGSVSRLCAGDRVRLDGTPSTGCAPGSLEFRWLEGAVVACDWSPTPTCDVTPASSTAYTLEVRCTLAPTCVGSILVNVGVDPWPTALLAVPQLVCTGDQVTLDASGSNPGGCSGPLEYQFRNGAVVLCAWSSQATCGPLVTSSGNTTYTVDVRCGACVSSDDAMLTAIGPPSAVAGPDVDWCAGFPVTLDASASSTSACPGGALFEWWEGAVLRRPASSNPRWSPPTGTAGNYLYTARVVCSTLPTCASSDDVLLRVASCTLSVHFDAYRADRTGTGVVVRFRTLAEDGSNFFVVERAPSVAGAPGTFARVGEPIDARGSGSSYTFLDPSPEARADVWYRVVEYTANGRGDSTGPFRATTATGDPSPAGAGRARGEHGRR